jgi:hypothetical protein
MAEFWLRARLEDMMCSCGFFGLHVILSWEGDQVLVLDRH